MVLYPPARVSKFMELTYIDWNFKLYIIGLGVVYFALAWVGEHRVFQPLARLVKKIKESVFKQQKERKQYKLIQEQMLF
jgi:cation-transporting ATPase 13A3/4/5